MVEKSEFYHSKGSYAPTISHIDPSAGFASLNCKTPIWQCIEKIAAFQTIPSPENGTAKENAVCVGLSLAKSYLTVCNVLDCLEDVSRKGFCDESFTILVQTDPQIPDVAELIRIKKNAMVDFLEAIESTILKVFKAGRPSSDRATSHAIEQTLLPSCVVLLEHLGSPLQQSISLYDTLVLCRILAIFLDLGLVSYMGSHGSRFDIEYVHKDCSTLLVSPDTQRGVGFRFSLRRLACLDGFLNHQLVWVFQPLWTAPEKSRLSDKPISILTTIESLADTWGPVWEVSAGLSFPNYIRQLNLSTGLICKARTEFECPIEGAIPCHWFNSSGMIPLPSPMDYDNCLIRKNSRLLIGGLWDTTLTRNRACSYKLDDLERDYGLRMTPLGTSPSWWAFDQRQIGFSASHYLGITAAGTQKKNPRVTQKQAIWNKWKNEPKRANPRILNLYLGVEISHCTGNARRVPLRNLFTMKPIQSLLGRQFPEWLSTEFGLSLQAAFYSDNDGTIEDVWVKHHKYREQMAEIVCCVLELLEKTGTEAGKFSAAFLNHNRELSLPVELRLNSWAEFLEDSDLTAVYAIVNETCLDTSERGHFFSTCNSSNTAKSAFTAFETQIAVPLEQLSNERILVNQRGCFQRVSKPDEDPQVLIWELGKVRELGGKLGRMLGAKQSQVLSREVQEKYELGGQHLPVLVKSAIPSFGGHPARRTGRMSTSIGQTAGNVTPLSNPLPNKPPVHDRRGTQIIVQRQDQLPRPSA